MNVLFDDLRDQFSQDFGLKLLRWVRHACFSSELWWYITPSNSTHVHLPNEPRYSAVLVSGAAFPWISFGRTSTWSNTGFRLIKCLSFFLASPWNVIKMNSADCRCFLECLLISPGGSRQKLKVMFFHIFARLFICLFICSVAFLFNILWRCAAFIHFMRSILIEQRRCGAHHFVSSSFERSFKV